MDMPGIFPRLLQQLDQHRPGLGGRINHELVFYTGMTYVISFASWGYVHAHEHRAKSAMSWPCTQDMNGLRRLQLC